MKILDALYHIISDQDVHHFDSICYVGLRHSLSLFAFTLLYNFCLISAYMIYFNQWMTFAQGMYISDIKEKILIFKDKRAKAVLDCFLSSGALFLDYHLLRMNLMLTISILIVLYGIRYNFKQPILYIVICDIFLLLFIELIHVSCLVGIYKVFRIFMETTKLWFWLKFCAVLNIRHTLLILIASFIIEGIWIILYLRN